MHPIWRIDDILILILEYLDRPDLAALTRVNRDLCDLSINQLWKTIPSFAPLINTLPDGVKSRPLKFQDIERMDMYASKVRHVCFEGQTNLLVQVPWQWKIDPKNPRSGKSWEELWTEIAELRPTSQFLPHLRSIHVNQVEEDLLIPLIGISGSNLQKVSIRYVKYEKEGSTIHRILSELQDYSKLENIWVRDGGHHLLPTSLIKAAPLNRIAIPTRYFSHSKDSAPSTACPIRTEIFEKSELRSLTLSLSRDWHTPKAAALTGKFFPKLHSLWLDLTTLRPQHCGRAHAHISDSSWTCEVDSFSSEHTCARQPPTAFFDLLDNPDLTLLNIKFPFCTKDAQLLSLTKSAQKNCKLQNLTELAFAGAGAHRAGGTYSDWWPEWTISPAGLKDVLHTLLPLPVLTTLRMTVAPSFLNIFDLRVYEELAAGLPVLEKLLLCHPVGDKWEAPRNGFCQSHYGDNVALRNVAAFCSMLPRLVEVSVGEVVVSGLEGEPGLEWVSTELKWFMACEWKGCEISDRERLDVFLDTWFPNAKFSSGLPRFFECWDMRDSLPRVGQNFYSSG